MPQGCDVSADKVPLDQPLPCIGCSYDLRGQPKDSVCPGVRPGGG